MFSHFGGEILYLNRVEFAGLRLDKDLGPGEFRLLTDEEMKLIAG